MNATRKLVLTDGRWRFETVPSSETPADTTYLTVDTTLLPPDAMGEGVWVGHDEGSPPPPSSRAGGLHWTVSTPTGMTRWRCLRP